MVRYIGGSANIQYSVASHARPTETNRCLQKIMGDIKNNNNIRVKYTIIQNEQQRDNVQRRCFVMYNSLKLCNISIPAGNGEKVDMEDPFFNEGISGKYQ